MDIRKADRRRLATGKVRYRKARPHLESLEVRALLDVEFGATIAAENALAGSPAEKWDVVDPVPNDGVWGDPSIEGFATDISVDQEQTIPFKIKTDATDYRLDIYRIGYYGGAGAR